MEVSAWKKISDELLALTKKCGGPSKSGSGTLTVQYQAYGKIYVEFGAYDIADFPRHYEIGTFDNEIAAIAECHAVLKHMEETVNSCEDFDE